MCKTQTRKLRPQAAFIVRKGTVTGTRGGRGAEKSAFGCLRRFANPAKISGEKGAWERAVVEKYAKS